MITVIYFNISDTELKRSSKIFISVSERHSWVKRFQAKITVGKIGASANVRTSGPKTGIYFPLCCSYPLLSPTAVKSALPVLYLLAVSQKYRSFYFSETSVTLERIEIRKESMG